MTKCPECKDTGARDSGGTHPWGEPVLLPCDCKDAEIGRRWREDSSLAKWFPITAERLAAKERENLHLAREARTCWEALRDLLAAHAMRASCQAGLVERCKCVTCATARAREALGPNVRGEP